MCINLRLILLWLCQTINTFFGVFHGLIGICGLSKQHGLHTLENTNLNIK